MSKLKQFVALNIDLLASAGALAWAVAASFVPELAALVAPKAALTAAGVFAGRAYIEAKKA